MTDKWRRAWRSCLFCTAALGSIQLVGHHWKQCTKLGTFLIWRISLTCFEMPWHVLSSRAYLAFQWWKESLWHLRWSKLFSIGTNTANKKNRPIQHGETYIHERPCTAFSLSAANAECIHHKHFQKPTRNVGVNPCCVERLHAYVSDFILSLLRAADTTSWLYCTRPWIVLVSPK